LYSVSPSAQLKQVACGIGDWLLKMQRADGSFLAMYDGEAGEWHHAGEAFFDDGACLHAKHAIGLLKLGEVIGDGRYTKAARRVCDWVLTLQGGEGAFRASERLTEVVAHSHCYATEGLLFAHYVLGAEHYLEAARRACEWLARSQNRDGSISLARKQRWWRAGRRIIEKLVPPRVTDATAQALRVWLILYCLEGQDSYLAASRRAARFLGHMQCNSTLDPNAHGGFLYSPRHHMMYAWCTMFAVGALHALETTTGDDAYEKMMTGLF